MALLSSLRIGHMAGFNPEDANELMAYVDDERYFIIYEHNNNVTVCKISWLASATLNGNY